jgi:ABC-type transport system involved in cytochrome c biogenesis permease component
MPPPASSASALAAATRQRTGMMAWGRRIAVLAMHTFTQLVRMKVFHFLFALSLVLFAAGFIFSSVSPDAELKMVKDAAFGTMLIFGVLFGVVSVALLLPKDMEDRTLYTILTKPVRRYEYLLGKYLGVLLVVFVSLLMLDVLASVVLQLKFNWAYQDKVETIQAMTEGGKFSVREVEQMKADELAQLSQQGLRLDLHLAVVAIFLKISVITAVAMAISTIAGSTIFTMMATLCIYVIGHLQAGARESLLAPQLTHEQVHARINAGRGVKPPGWRIPMALQDAAPITPPQQPGVLVRIASGMVAVIFPDFQVYNVVDSVVAGKDLKGGDLGKMFGLSAVYLAIYLGAAVFLFAEKEL